jgi:esterase/lipase
MQAPDWPRPDPALQRWAQRLCTEVRARRGVRLRLHDDAGGFERGDIFLFSADFPACTLLPQYCVFEATGAASLAVIPRRSGRERVPPFPDLGRALGFVDAAVPARDWTLVRGLFSGHKLVFTAGPDGDDLGAARLVTALAVLFETVRRRIAAGDLAEMSHWAERLGLCSLAQLEARVARPPVLVPLRVTAWPASRPEDLLDALAAVAPWTPAADRFDELTRTFDPFGGASEVDVRGDSVLPVTASPDLAARAALRVLGSRLRRPEDALPPYGGGAAGLARLATRQVERAASDLRRRALEVLDRGVTVNLEHLGAAVLVASAGRAPVTLERRAFAEQVYQALKRLQPAREIHLHRSLCDPSIYAPLAQGDASRLAPLLDAAEASGRLLREGERLHLRVPPADDRVGMLAAAAGLPEVRAAVAGAIAGVTATEARGAAGSADFAVDDLRVEHAWDRHVHSRPAHRAINALQTATADAAPFLLEPARARPLGVLLVHGFLASPAEMRPLAERLADERFPVLGVRLRGHGTSPWDLARRGFEEWLESLERGYALLRERHSRVAVVGFSTGAALALLHAAASPAGLAGVAACAPPLRFRNPRMHAVPLVHGANRLLARLTQAPGPLSFRPNLPEHPEVNYRHMPLRGLHELRRLVATLEPRLGAVRCPTLVLQATEDPVVERRGTEALFAALGSAEKSLHWVPSQRHGILRANVGDAHARISEFLQGL